MSQNDVFRWLLNTHDLWDTPFEGVEPFKSTDHWATGHDAQRGLGFLSPLEQAKVLKFYRQSDAKLSLGSCLIKRRAISDALGTNWADVTISEDKNRKPCYRPSASSPKPMEFNVSHHGTLVALVGCVGDNTKLGVDIVRMNWEKDYTKVIEEGFEAWATTYEMVFSDREVRDIADYIPPPQTSKQEEVRAKLRHFYAHWCMKEAYVKMTGEALLASWLKALEFRDVQVPAPAVTGDWGESCTNAEIWFHGQRVFDVKLEIQAYKDDYMVATCSSNLSTKFGAFHICDLDYDIYPQT